jgi:hypothetical protein
LFQDVAECSSLDLPVERDNDSSYAVLSFENVVIFGPSNVPLSFEENANNILLPDQSTYSYTIMMVDDRTGIYSNNHDCASKKKGGNSPEWTGLSNPHWLLVF